MLIKRGNEIKTKPVKNKTYVSLLIYFFFLSQGFTWQIDFMVFNINMEINCLDSLTAVNLFLYLFIFNKVFILRVVKFITFQVR